MKIAFFEPYSQLVGGAQKCLLLLMRELKRKGVEELLLVPEEGVVSEMALSLGIEVEIVTPPKALNLFHGKALKLNVFDCLFSYLPAFFTYNINLVRIIKGYRIDLLFFNTPRACLISGLAPLLARIPSILYIHGYLLNPGLYSTLIEAAVSFIPNKIITVSENLRSNLKGPFINLIKQRKMLVVYDAIDLTNFPVLNKRTFNEIKEAPIIGTAATIIPYKGLHILIEAFARIKQKYQNAKLFLAGHIYDRDYFGELNKLVERLGLTKDCVKFLGWQDNVSSFLNDIDIFVFPSFTEGFGLSVLEAMASGLPVIATNVGAIPEMIIGESGLLVEPQNAIQIAEAIEKILENPLLIQTLRKNATMVRKNFSLENQVTNIYEICHKIISKDSGKCRR